MFESARAKLERADKHISDFESETASLILTKRHHAILDRHGETGALLVRAVQDPATPKNLAVVIGDAVHNLRSALDHMTCSLIEKDGGTPDGYTHFPQSKGSIGDYKATCQGIKTPRSDTKKFFEGIEACKRGSGEILHYLHILDVLDKHISITPIISLTTIRLADMEIRQPDGSVVLHAGYTNAFFSTETPRKGALIFYLGPEIVGVNFEKKPQTSFDVSFGDIEVFPHEPISPTLSKLRRSVADAINRATEFVETRAT